MSDDDELAELFKRFTRLRRSLVCIQAELDNVRELIRLKEFK
jgi:hypothetical protein